MEIFRELVKIDASCVGLGFFDGVHLGHRALIEKLVNRAKSLNSKSVLLTFQKSPAENFVKNFRYITSDTEKKTILNELGIDYMVELDFSKLVNYTAEDYISKIIYTYFRPKYITSGFNHTFGKNKSGNPEMLRTYQNRYNYIYEEIPPVKAKEEIISSTLIKELLHSGNITKANNLLGHSFKIEGIVVEGNKLGRTIGFPTANILYPDYKTQIPFGVYKTTVKYKGNVFSGLLNYGVKPTINSKNQPVAEVHIIGFNENIYGNTIEISILDRIRNEKKFSSLDELKHQIKEDLNVC